MIGKIISGGQTGADRAALDWAISHGIPHGGSCPKGRLANVIDSDVTLILSIGKTLRGGSKKTAEFAERLSKPWLHVSAADPDGAVNAKGFIEQHQIKVLNIAGPRASSELAVGEFVRMVLENALG